MSGSDPNARFSIDPESVAAARAELREMARGNEIAEAAVEGFTDWQAIEAMERLWAAATSELEPEPDQVSGGGGMVSSSRATSWPL